MNVSPFTSGMVGIDLGGYSSPLIGYSASLPWIRSETNIDLVNIWTKTKGNHTVKWGVELRRIRDDLLQTQTFSPRGLYRFRTPQTSVPGAPTGFGNDFGSFGACFRTAQEQTVSTKILGLVRDSARAVIPGGTAITAKRLEPANVRGATTIETGSLRGLVELVKGKRWLSLARWVNRTSGKRLDLNALFAINRKLMLLLLRRFRSSGVYTG